jgi:NADH:ubiquinone oxidoreductase subunit 3 (subunit A)
MYIVNPRLPVSGRRVATRSHSSPPFVRVAP